MNPDDASWSQPGTVAAQDHRDAGTIVRIARQAEGLTLAQLGARCGYSASQVSRYERGIQPLTDIVVLRRFADALELPPQIFGLFPLTVDPQERHNTATRHKVRRINSTPLRVGCRPLREDGEDPVRRRELLAGIVGVAGGAALGRPAAHATTPDPTAGVEELLYGHTAAEPLPLATLRSATTWARDAFQAARYRSLSTELPKLIAAATATCDQAHGDDRLHASALLADAYTVTCNLMVKLNDDTLAWATADRAFQAAVHSEDPLALADARRSVATVLRRTGRAAKAHNLLVTAATDIQPDGKTSPAQLSMYGTLLQVAAYTAAVDGNRAEAHDLITEAAAAAARLGHDANHRHTAFGPTNVTLYQVSIA
ncbi:MAG TPA: helix-turn-helix transcriptional regulator, partial [Mycobacteriales bacterium]